MTLIRAMGGALALVALAGCWASEPDPGAPTGRGDSSSGYRTVPNHDPAVRLAVAEGLSQLRRKGWLSAPGLMAREPLAAEKRAGGVTTFHVTLPIVNETRRRLARLTVRQDAERAYHLEAAELGPLGSDAPLPGVPTPTEGVPGGWQNQPVDQAAIKEAVASARLALSGADWLNRPVTAGRVVAAGTQVVAGTNVYVAFDGTVDGQPRLLHAIVFQPLNGPDKLEWARIETP